MAWHSRHTLAHLNPTKLLIDRLIWNKAQSKFSSHWFLILGRAIDVIKNSAKAMDIIMDLIVSPPKRHIRIVTPRTWECDLNLEIGSFLIIEFNMRSLGWALIRYDWCPSEKGIFGNRDDTQRRKMMWRHWEKRAIYKPSRETWNRSFLHTPRKEPTLMTPRFWILASWSVGKISV